MTLSATAILPPPLRQTNGDATAVSPPYSSTQSGFLFPPIDLAGAGEVGFNCNAPGPSPTPTPGNCNKAAVGWTSPSGKVAPYKTFTCVNDD